MPSRSPGATRLAAIAAGIAILLSACGGERAAADDSQRTAADSVRAETVEDLTVIDTAIAPELDIDLSRMTRQPSGLYVLERRVGTGATADSGKWVSVSYTGWLTNGTVIDDTRKAGKPRDVLLGYGRVIPAWEEGLRGMRAGGRRILVVPPALGYGKAGQPGRVPSRATLVFDIELARVH